MMHETADQPLAVVGMACRLPGADGLDAYWRLLLEGRSAIDVLPPERLDPELYYDPQVGVVAKSYSRIGGLVDSRPVDLSGCPLPPEVIAKLDPCHLALWEVAARACENAGFDPQNLPDRRAGVFVGHSRASPLVGDLTCGTLVEQTAQFLRQIEGFDAACGSDGDAVIREMIEAVRRETPKRDDQAGAWLEPHFAASLLAQAFGLDGPRLVINNACASGLTALALGAWAIQTGSIDMAVVGSASRVSHNTLLLFSHARSVSATGSRPFDASADGLVAAEGYVVLLVKGLAKALADGNRILAVVRGIGVSTDGRGKAVWAPRKEGQIEAVLRAYRGGLDASRLQYIEAHATSTQVGDATEVAALAAAMEGKLPAGTRIPMGAVKSNIGHTLETAGLAGLVKTILAMHHGEIPPTIHLLHRNPEIDWERIPFFVPTAPHPWPAPADGHPRRAAVNAFGIGGLNVHVVLDQGPLPGEEGPQVSMPIPSCGTAAPGCAELPNAVESGGATLSGTAEGGCATSVSKASGVSGALAVVGMGAVLPGARTIDGVWELLASGRDAKSRVPPERWHLAGPDSPGRPGPWRDGLPQGGFVTGFEYDWRRHKIPPKQIAQADPLQFMILDAVDQVLASAGYPEQPLDRMRTGVVVGVPFHGDFFADLQIGFQLPRFQRTLAAVLRRRGVPAETVEALCRRFGDVVLTQMPGLLDDTGSFSSSSLASRVTKTFDFMGGAVILDSGAASAGAALSVAADMLRLGRCDAVICVSADRAMGVMKYEKLRQAGRLASDPSHGPLDAQAAGFVPGEGVGAVLLKRLEDVDRSREKVLGVLRGVAMARAESLGEAVEAAARRGLDRAGVAPEEVVAVETTCAGNAASDEQEVRALGRTYGPRPEERPLVVGTLAGQMGHVSGAAGMLSLVKTILALEHQAMPASVGLHTPASFVAELGPKVRVVQRKTPLVPARDDGRLLAAVSCHNTKDTAYHMIVERPVPVPTRAPQSERIEPRAGRPRVAFVFPGQGSQYAGMLKPLVEQFAPARRAFEEVEATLGRLGYPTFADLAWDNAEQLGKDVFRTQLAMLAADTIVHAAVSALGIRPDRITGHSFGQFPALVAAGGWTFEAAARATFARCRAIESSKTADGTMLCVYASIDTVERVCRETGGRVYVANHNSPRQTIVGGDHESIAALLTQLRQEGLHSQQLPVPRPFHTPLMDEVKAPLADALAGLLLEPPTVPFLSGVSNRYTADPEDLRTDLINQMTWPVRYVALIERLAAEGVTVFVEVGPQQILTGLNRQILGDRNVLLIGCDHRRRGGLEVLRALRSALKAAGVPVGADELLESVSGSPLPLRERARVRAEHGVVQSPLTPGPSPEAGEGRNRLTPLPQPRVPGPQPPVPGPQPEEQLLGVLRLAGTPYEMGLQHGRAQAEAIRAILRRYADLANGDAGPLPPLNPGPGPIETLFAPEDFEELAGIAEGAGVGREAVVAHNLRLFPDLAAGCSHFAVAAGANSGEGLFHGANEDLPLGLTLRDCLVRNVQVRCPKDRIAHLLFGTAGEAGGINGINARGVAVTSAMLLDLPRTPKARGGRLHGVLVKRILEYAEDVDSALEILRRTPRIASGWGLLISHGPSDEVCYVEYHGATLAVRRGQSRVVAGNRSLQSEPLTPAPDHCRHRIDRLTDLVGDAAGKIDAQRAKEALRDRFDRVRGRETPHPTMNTVRRVDNQISLVMQPGQGIIWATPGSSRQGEEDRFYRLSWDRLLGSVSPSPVQTEQPKGAARSLPARATPALADKPPVAPQSPASSPQSPVPSPQSPAASPQPLVSSPQPADDRMCGRFVLRLREAPLGSIPKSLELKGGAVILGDNPVGEAIRAELSRRGVNVAVVSTGLSQEESLAALQRAWQSGPTPHLFLTGAYDAQSATCVTEPGWSQRLSCGVLLPFWFCQRWFQLVSEAGLVDQATVVAVAALGGDFGFSGRVASAESGALAGLMKALGVEITRLRKSEFRSKVVDFAPGESPTKMAETVLQELAGGNRDVEVAYRGGRRYVVRPVLQPAAPAGKHDVPCGGVWVVTGGARGVTAIVARELGRRFGVKLHLIGSSPAPEIDPAWLAMSPEELRQVRARVTQEALARKQVPIEAWKRVEKSLEIVKNLRAMAEAGVRAEYHACDVRDRDALDHLLRAIRAADGPIQGVMHGAGFESALRFEKKKPRDVELTVRTKLGGAAALMDLTRQDPLRYFLAFGSISGRFGGVGQTDYCLANDMLSKLVDGYSRSRPECRSTCFHWHSWDEVGMAVRPESKHIKDALLVRFMPTREGAEHVIEEILLGVPEPEILITDVSHIRKYYPDVDQEAGDRGQGSGVGGRESEGGMPSHGEAVGRHGGMPSHGEAVGREGGMPSHGEAVGRHGTGRTCSPAESPHPNPLPKGEGTKERPLPKGEGTTGASDWPLIDAVTEIVPHRQLTASIHLHPGEDPFLVQHRVRQRPVVPGAVFLELMTQAASLLAGGKRPVAVRDFSVVKAISFFAEQPSQAKIQATREGDRVVCRVTSDFHNRQGLLVARDRLHAHGIVELGDSPPAGVPGAFEPPPQWVEARFLDREDVVYHGPVLRRLRQIYVERDKAWGLLEAGPTADLGGNRRPDRWVVAPAMLDACFMVCGVHVWRTRDRAIALPTGVDCLRIGRLPRPGEQCLLRLQLRGGNPGKEPLESVGYDFVLHGDDNAALLRAENSRCVILPEKNS